jgi:hypothetical protein
VIAPDVIQPSSEYSQQTKGASAITVRHTMTIRLQASVQSLAFIILLAVTLFGTVGRFNIIEFWVYIAIVAAVSALSLTILDTDLMQERMRPGGVAA